MEETKMCSCDRSREAERLRRRNAEVLGIEVARNRRLERWNAERGKTINRLNNRIHKLREDARRAREESRLYASLLDDLHCRVRDTAWAVGLGTAKPIDELLEAIAEQCDPAYVRTQVLNDLEWPCDADGDHISIGGDYYGENGRAWRVLGLRPGKKYDVVCKPRGGADSMAQKMRAKWLSKDFQVLAADGRPVKAGETVWLTRTEDQMCEEFDTCAPLVVREVHPPDGVDCERDDCAFLAIPSDCLTHERPDSWDRLEEDAAKMPCDYFGSRGAWCSGCRHGSFATGADCGTNMRGDIIRRAKALAGREAGR